MDTLIGLRGNNFVILAADTYSINSIIKLKNNDNTKFYDIKGNKCLLLGGSIGDRLQFGEFIRKNIHLYQYQNNSEMLVKSFAFFTRKNLAYYLRKNPYEVNCLMAGFDKDGYQLYWCDYLSNMDSVNKGAHGYGAYLVSAILDKYYHENLTVDEALNIFKLCFEELKKRFLLTQINYELRIMHDNKIETQYVTI
ncbi:proteasome subunit beta type-2, putative [Plasmodium sp. gorilla clade G2]|uniref:proteasome subunit beta type-2, putative n=1 Tax=Plasmodium sp. gorilla clade G2 TaxID=880535 RepID=UPI000D2235BF|nr:proteasome subunit beta type-2, putative [Plasmodium sp. gorilla clade G2]SOV19909.1 proteasome subunit beta type-2, putative [Plasmodium sp. gorilla clade G2]